MRWQLNFFNKNGEVVPGLGPKVDNNLPKMNDDLENCTDEELLAMYGDGLFGSQLPKKEERYVPKRIETIEEDIEKYVEEKSREELK